MKKITQKQIKEISKFISLFPKEISVHAAPSEDGGFYADILTFPGCHTQGETLSELIDMINDCMYTYFEVPEKYISYMPSYMMPVEVGERFGLLPNTNELMLKGVKQREIAKS